MKVAVAADAHLTSRANHPERYDAMEEVFRRSVDLGIEQIILAGDIFDRDLQSCADFEELCACFPGLHLHIIPGNHDTYITGRKVTCRNVSIYTEPESVVLDGVTVLFVPYEENRVMGSRIASREELIPESRWVLVGHGDYHGGVTRRNPYEPGTYMPLSASDINRFKPWRVFLGHIHKPTDQGIVHYPGSPCGLDINETGLRRFLVFDTDDGSVTPVDITSGPVFFSESFVVLPGEKEIERLRRDIRERVESWGIDPGDAGRIRLRVMATGYSSDRQAVLDAISEEFGKYTWYDGDGPDISSLSFSDDMQLNAIADRARFIIEELEFAFEGDEPARDMVIESALRVIYDRGAV